MDKLTFKEYWHMSRTQLVEAANAAPCVETMYNVRSYCKLPLLNEEAVSLKPKQKVIVKWLYEDIDQPICVSVRFEGVNNVDSTDAFEASWKDSKVSNWLKKNTNEITL